ncbi:hypothetical protein GCM10023340_40520 [Nocardioides marinquilinus]|uniref:Sensor domain-containing protein n=1 Tax=Nocardioides marinquilinus TaxID=1210400 RepID=A0ABP9Q0R4_9ACTN
MLRILLCQRTATAGLALFAVLAVVIAALAGTTGPAGADPGRLRFDRYPTVESLARVVPALERGERDFEGDIGFSGTVERCRDDEPARSVWVQQELRATYDPPNGTGRFPVVGLTIDRFGSAARAGRWFDLNAAYVQRCTGRHSDDYWTEVVHPFAAGIDGRALAFRSETWSHVEGGRHVHAGTVVMKRGRDVLSAEIVFRTRDVRAPLVRAVARAFERSASR